MAVKKVFLLTVGWICVVLGLAGIFLPLLPTTPFILLASWCFAKSSKRFHDWLLNHSRFGPIIETWRSGRGISKKIRNRVVLTIAITMSISAFIVGRWWVTAALAMIGVSVTIYLWRLPNPPENPVDN